MGGRKTGKTKKPDPRKRSGKPGQPESAGSGEWLSAEDGLKLFVRHWTPQNGSTETPAPLHGGVHIVHGMAEHSLRYEWVAQKLCKAGFEVWAPDMRGHGKTADLAINDPGLGGLLGHCADEDGTAKVTGDIALVTNMIRKIRPEMPVFLLGHSWGSFLAQNYIETYCDHPLAGCMLSGTRGPDGLRIAGAVPLMGLLAWAKGARKISQIAHTATNAPFSRPFKPARTPFDWLSRDEAEVDAYLADPFSGKMCSAGFYRDLSLLLQKIHKPESLDLIRKSLPVYIFCGSADPVGDMGQSPTALVNAYRTAGITDLEFVLYPDARHETLHETNREEVTDNLLDWLFRRCRGEPRFAHS